MSRAIRVVGVLGVVVALAASASAPKQHDVQSTTKVRASFDATWTSVIDVFADRNWPTQALERDSGLVSTDWLAMTDAQAEQYSDCGGSGLASVHGHQGRFNVRVKEVDGSTSVSVNTLYREMRSFDGRQWFADCTSKGKWEAELTEIIEQRATSMNPRKSRTKAVDAEAKAEPRGFFCMSSPSNAEVGTCVRKKASCESTRAALVAAIADLAPCTLIETAWCVGELCAPNEALCDAQQKAAGVVDDCAETY